jgi:hypothetical protein
VYNCWNTSVISFTYLIKKIDNESKSSLSAMAGTASKLLQRLHNEDSITQGITIEWYCEKLWKIPLAEDEDVDQFEIYESIRIRTEARSS